jgi:hypothetical protein
VPICPECKREFKDGTDDCPHCNVPLLATVEPELDDTEDTDVNEDVDEDLPSEGLVVIETADDEDGVGRLREYLEESGIPCFLSNELCPHEPANACTKVLVPREMANDARKLVRNCPR